MNVPIVDDEIDLATLEARSGAPRTSIWRWIRKEQFPRGRRVYGYKGKAGSCMVWPASLVALAEDLLGARKAPQRQEVLDLNDLKDEHVREQVRVAMRAAVEVAPTRETSGGEVFFAMRRRRTESPRVDGDELVIGVLASARQHGVRMSTLIRIAERMNAGLAATAVEQWRKGQTPLIVIDSVGDVELMNSVEWSLGARVVVPVAGLLDDLADVPAAPKRGV